MEEIGRILEEYYYDLNENKTRNIRKYLDNFKIIENTLKQQEKQQKQQEKEEEENEENKDININIKEQIKVINEIKNNCILKSIQIIRGIYSDIIRNIITNCRKQLRVKIALNIENNNNNNNNNNSNSNSNEYTQRYLNILIELLGVWSNVISEILQYNLYNDLFINCIQLFHNRVIEASFDCYEEFKQNRKLETWSTKFLSSYDMNGINSGNENVNLTTLDQILSQLASMRLVVAQYQIYLIEGCYIEDENQNYQSNSIESEVNNNDNDNDNNNISTINLFIQLATDSNISKWKEAEGMYIVLERLYLQHAIRHALSSCNWKNNSPSNETNKNNDSVLIQLQPNVYALQAIEDVFFIFDRVITRALSLCIQTPALFNQSCSLPFSICSYIIELMDYSDLNNELFSLFYILHKRDVYVGIEKLINNNFHGEKKDEEPSQTTLTSPTKKSQEISKNDLYDDEPDVEINDVVEYANAIGADLAVGTMALAGVAGGWLASFAAPIGFTNTQTEFEQISTSSTTTSTTSGATTTITTKSPTKIASPPNSNSSINNSISLQQTIQITTSTSSSSSSSSSDYLSHHDVTIYINSVSIAVLSIQNLKELIQDILSSDELSKNNPLNLTIQEFQRLRIKYENLQITLLKSLLEENLFTYFHSCCDSFFLSSNTQSLTTNAPISSGGFDGKYVITSNEVDVRLPLTNSLPLMHLINTILGINQDSINSTVPQEITQYCEIISSSFSTYSLFTYFKLIACELNDYFLKLIIGETIDQQNSQQHSIKKGIGEGINFNEWGSLLFYDQVLLIVKLFEEVVLSLVDESIKPCFTILLWVIKILTLDRPADIKRCGVIPIEVKSKKRYIEDDSWYYIEGNEVKQIMRRRIDFSKEVINSLKLDIT